MPSGGPITLHVDAHGLAASAATIDALSRLALIAKRHGCEISLSGVSDELCALIDFAGLSEVLRAEALRPRSTPPRC